MASARGERQARAKQRRRALQGRRVPWGWILAVAGVVALGAAYFTLAAPKASAPGGPASEAADPRITLLTGQPAPEFALPSTNGATVRLSDLRAKGNVLLYFQEGIMCPPCWQQMGDLKRDGDRLKALNVTLVTVTVDQVDALRQTAARYGVDDLILLSDRDLAVSRTYQMLYTGMMGGTAPGHSFVLVSPDGTILWRKDFREMYVPDQQILDPVAKALGK